MSSLIRLAQIVTSSAILVFLLSSTGLAYTCYFPDSTVAESYVACSPNGDGSCCLKSDFCTSLGYCVSQSKGYHYRGACTDSTWFNPSCPDYCLAGQNSGNGSAVNLIACNAAQTGGSWCCAYDGNCCSSSTFTPSWGTLFAEGATPSSSSGTQTTTVPTLTSPSSTSTTTSTTTKSPTSQASGISSTAPKSNKLTVVRDAVVPSVLGLVVLVSVIGLYYRERRRRIKAERAFELRSDPARPQTPMAELRHQPKNDSTRSHELGGARAHELGG